MKDYFLRKKFAKAWQFADSAMSRGLKGQRVSEDVKDIRSISCHGSNDMGLAPCEDRMHSGKYAHSFYCGACNCGDFNHTQLSNLSEEHYSKLDYPRIHCPKNMPGFTNYVPLTIEQKNDSSGKWNRHGLIEDTFGVDYLSKLNEEKKA